MISSRDLRIGQQLSMRSWENCQREKRRITSAVSEAIFHHLRRFLDERGLGFRFADDWPRTRKHCTSTSELLDIAGRALSSEYDRVCASAVIALDCPRR